MSANERELFRERYSTAVLRGVASVILVCVDRCPDYQTEISFVVGGMYLTADFTTYIKHLAENPEAVEKVIADRKKCIAQVVWDEDISEYEQELWGTTFVAMSLIVKVIKTRFNEVKDDPDLHGILKCMLLVGEQSIQNYYSQPRVTVNRLVGLSERNTQEQPEVDTVTSIENYLWGSAIKRNKDNLN